MQLSLIEKMFYELHRYMSQTFQFNCLKRRQVRRHLDVDHQEGRTNRNVKMIRKTKYS